MPKVPYPYEVCKWQIVHGKWFINTNLFLIKPFLIAKFDCNLISGQFTESFGSRKYLAVQMSTDEVNHLRATIDQMKNELHEERTRVDALKACLEQEREKYNKLTTSMDQNQPQSIQLTNGNKITVIVFQPAHL